MVVDGGQATRLGTRIRTRWAAIGAALAVTFGAGGLAYVNADSAPSSFVAITPTRVLDTRPSTNVGLTGAFQAEVGRKLQLTGAIPAVTNSNPFTVGNVTVVPQGATAVVLNVTATNTVAAGFISVRPGDQSGKPSTSNVNFVAGQTVPNSVTVELPTAGSNTGQIDVHYRPGLGNTADIIVDVVGYYLVGGGTGTPGPEGRAGPQGPAGAQGPAGTAGQDGADGADGTDGTGGAATRQFGYDIVYAADIISDARVAFGSPAMAIGIDGFPIIAHRDLLANRLRVTHCLDAACAQSDTFSPDDIASSGSPDIAIGADGLPVIAHQVNELDLRLTICEDLACSTAVGTTIDSLGLEQLAFDPSIAIGIDGRPIIAHYHPDGNGLRISVCNNTVCSNASSTTFAAGASPTNNAGLGPSIAIGSDGLPVIAHQDDNIKALQVSRCTTALCGAITSNTVDAGPTGADVGFAPSLAIDDDGFPAVSHFDETDQRLRISRCSNVACSAATNIDIDDGPVNASAGDQSSIAIGFDGLPIVSHYEASVDRLRITQCNNTACDNPDSANPASGGDFSAIAIGGDGNVVIAHRALGADLGIVHLSKSAWTPGGSN